MNPSHKKIKIQICQGTACFVLGASELQGVEESLPNEWRDIFEFSASSCLNLCNERQNLGRMPYIMIDDVPYADMTQEKLFNLLQEKAAEILKGSSQTAKL